MGFKDFGLAYYGQHFQYKEIANWIAIFASKVPEEDWKGIDRVYVYDEAPSHGRQDVSGGYYPPGSIRPGAAIAIYINQALGHLFSFHGKWRLFLAVRNRLFVATFGKNFIEHTLFHEVGHHKYRLKADNEPDADNYANELFAKVHPFIHRNYQLFNGIYRLVCRRRIKHSNEMRAK